MRSSGSSPSNGLQHLLQRDHVGTELGDHEAGACGVRRTGTVQARPTVHVVGRDRELAAHLATRAGMAGRPDDGEVRNRGLERLLAREVPSALAAKRLAMAPGVL